MVSTLQLSGLATRLAAPARLLAARFLRPSSQEPAGQAPVPVAQPLAAPPDRERFHVPVTQTSAEELAWENTVAQYAAMAEDGRWSGLLEALLQADRNRTAAPGGRRLAGLISQGARAALIQRLAQRDWQGAEAEIDRLQAALAPHAGHYAAAHLLAQAHLDLGWARRTAAPSQGVPGDVWQTFLRQTARAEAILDPFDPIEEMSPLLAATRYQLVRGIEDGETLFRDWYEDWSDLDPTNAEPHMAHAVHLLPEWFGSLAAFDHEARLAMKRTEICSGAAAYAAFYLAAADELGDLPQRMDLPLFLAGLQDYFRATGCQYRANIVAGAMTELLHAYTIDAAPGSGRLKLVLNTLTEHLTENLREVHLSAWQNGLGCLHFALEQVFASELARGEHVFVGVNGLTTRLPA
jgi:hypothetical protein